MTIEKLNLDEKLPFDEEALKSLNPKAAEYILNLVQTLQELLRNISQVANLAIDAVDGEAIYSRLKNSDGSYPLNTWRLIQVGNNWERQQQLTLGTWTKAGAFTPKKT